MKRTTKEVPPPTADVEKLKWRLWPQGDNKVIVYQNNEIETIITPESVSSEQGEWLCERHSEALTQALAPLEKRIGILERAIERRNIALDDANKLIRRANGR